MTEYIYGDVLFVIDFSMDFLSLYLTGKILHLKMKTARVVLAASVGAFYCVLALVLNSSAALGMVLEAVMAFLICAIAFGGKKVGVLIKRTAVLYTVSVLLGGAMTLIYSKLGKYKDYIDSSGDIVSALGDVPLWAFVLCAALSAGLAKLFSGIMSKRCALHQCEISLKIGGATRELTALVDSGNLIADPISEKPVVFISRAFWDMIPEKHRSAMKGESDNSDDFLGVRIIPCSTVGGSGVIYAIMPDLFYIKTKDEYEARDVLISVGENESYGGNDALVPSSII